MWKYRWVALAVIASAFLVACAGLLVSRAHHEQLFFALQIEERGLVLARPRLLGETGRAVTMRLVDPDRPEQAKLELELQPRRTGDTYAVEIGIALSDRSKPLTGTLDLKHGEERQLVLADVLRPVVVRMLVMRVESPEFEAYMELARREMMRETS